MSLFTIISQHPYKEPDTPPKKQLQPLTSWSLLSLGCFRKVRVLMWILVVLNAGGLLRSLSMSQVGRVSCTLLSKLKRTHKREVTRPSLGMTFSINTYERGHSWSTNISEESCAVPSLIHVYLYIHALCIYIHIIMILIYIYTRVGVIRSPEADECNRSVRYLYQTTSPVLVSSRRSRTSVYT